MALQFTVTAIEAPPVGQGGRQLISAGFGKDRTIQLNREIWPSLTPVAFALENLTVHFTLRGNFPFDQTWRAPGSKYAVEGKLGPVRLLSTQIDVPSHQDDVVYAEGLQFDGETRPIFTEPFTFTAPFNCTGNWKWTITHIAPPGAHQADPVHSAQPTAIEAYFFLGSVALPPYLGQGTHHVSELLRHIVLDLDEISQVRKDYDPIVFYAGHIARTMWAFGSKGPRYNCNRAGGGVSQYLSGANGNGIHFGGVFLLQRFLQRTLPLCNCYDLAGLIQVCCKALGNRPNPDKPGTELPFISAHWCFMRIFGYITPGPLFGWPEFNNVNNPFWKGVPGAQPDQSQDVEYFTEQMDPERQHFDNHTWIEYRPQNGREKVLDITHGFQAGPTLSLVGGQCNRLDYLRFSTEDGYKTNKFVTEPHMLLTGLPGVTAVE